MAKLDRIMMYEQAAAGVRTFKCATADLQAIRATFNRKGYKVHRERQMARRPEIVYFSVCKKSI